MLTPIFENENKENEKEKEEEGCCLGCLKCITSLLDSGCCFCCGIFLILNSK
jgi:hypothetical protein